MSDRPRIAPGIYEHYKSTPEDRKYYSVFFVSRHTETGEFVVCYRPLYLHEQNPEQEPEARPYVMFSEVFSFNGQPVERFRFVGASNSVWLLQGYDTFDATYYPFDGIYFTEADARRAAQERLASLETSQPSESSGGQDAHGIQDHVYIIRPDGSQYRFNG